MVVVSLASDWVWVVGSDAMVGVLTYYSMSNEHDAGDHCMPPCAILFSWLEDDCTVSAEVAVDGCTDATGSPYIF